MVSRTKVGVAALLLSTATAFGQVVAPNNKLTISWSGGGIKSASTTLREGAPRDRIVPTFSPLPDEHSIGLVGLDGGVRTDPDSILDYTGGNEGPAVAFFFGPRFARIGTFPVVRRGSSAWSLNSTVPAFDFTSLPLVAPCVEFTGKLTITELQTEQLPGRLHVMKLAATITGNCSSKGPQLKVVMNADEPSLGGTLFETPATDPPVATAEFPRSGTLSLTLTAENGSSLGGVIPGRTYRFSGNDGPWETYLRDPLTESGSLVDWGGAPPNHLEISIDLRNSKETNNPLFSISFKQLHDEGLQTGSFAFDDDVNGFPHMHLQLNLDFCAGGVTSSYTVEEFSYDCEFSTGGLPGILGAADKTVHVVPHLRTFRITFKTKCGNEKGGFRGTLIVNDNPGFDCAFPPTTGGGGTGGDTGGDTGGGTGGDSGGSTGGTPTTPSNGPTVVIPDSARSGIQLNNQQSTTIDLTTAIPSGFNADVELAAFSEPEGLAVSLSKSAIAAPGSGTSVLTIAAGADTRPQDYRVIISATGNGVTTYNIINVSVFCDPPVILGIDQPRHVTINSGASTTLEVKTNGSGPTIYQWYAGQSGATQTPIPGATNQTFNTGALTSTTDYWVRATNPCGSVDSNTATVTVH